MTVIPDSIEPIEEWRSWRFDGKHLLSLNQGTKWTPGEAMVARCETRGQQMWAIVRGGGMTREAAHQHADSYNQHQQQLATMMWNGAPTYLTRPAVEPPNGYGYALEDVTHNAPHKQCSCGIYACRSMSDCPPSGDILGKVKLWGTIVPGTKGSRAEYGYPSELHVPAHLADNAALLAYGVPIVVRTEKDLYAVVPGLSRSRSMPWPLRIAVAVNLVAAAVNLAMLALREWI